MEFFPAEAGTDNPKFLFNNKFRNGFSGRSRRDKARSVNGEMIETGDGSETVLLG
jgi:hypothetical protein